MTPSETARGKMTLNKINEDRRKFIQSNNITPKIVYLSKEDMQELRDDMQKRVLRKREKDLGERICPELLPPMKDTPDVTEGCMIYGMRIVESEIPGPYFGHRD